jgi:hypothetical protein
MTMKKIHYSLASEAFKSFFTGFALSLLTGILLWLIYIAVSTRLLQRIFYLSINFDFWRVEAASYFEFFYLFPFIAIMSFLIGVIQFLAVALPFANWISKGLEADLNRSWVFYGSAGALLGGAPWIALVLIFSKHTVRALEANAFLFYPGLSTGLFAGLMLKRRITKLAAASIENSTK